MFIQPIRHIENLEFLEIGHSLECYESINKGCICAVPLLREYRKTFILGRGLNKG